LLPTQAADRSSITLKKIRSLSASWSTWRSGVCGNVARDPAAAPVKVVQRQDVADSAHLRLTTAQANALLAAPGTETIMGIRDTALIAMMLCTGVREAELCALDVDDLREHYEGELALHIRKGKGLKARLVPYGELNWALSIVDSWMVMAGVIATTP